MDFLFEPIWKDFNKLQEKSNVTCEHSIRVADYAIRLADKLIDCIRSSNADEHLLKLFGELNLDDVKYKVYQAALHHDIGKFKAPDEILNKNGKLSREEFYVLWPHPYHGMEMLVEEGCEDRDILIGVYLSHERLNEKSYFKTKDSYIGLIARIIGVTDSFDSKANPHVNGEAARSDKQAALELILDNGLDRHIVRNFIEMEGIQISIFDRFKNKLVFQISRWLNQNKDLKN
ncbi:MAG: HD domain-containing protein [Candidatus Woesearchaeota archaeon]|nr:HD domain-containing protein [Candidatus Woesearchaeota archaeon]